MRLTLRSCACEPSLLEFFPSNDSQCYSLSSHGREYDTKHSIVTRYKCALQNETIYHLVGRTRRHSRQAVAQQGLQAKLSGPEQPDSETRPRSITWRSSSPSQSSTWFRQVRKSSFYRLVAG